MSHQANPEFWKLYHRLPSGIQKLADENFALLREREGSSPDKRFR